MKRSSISRQSTSAESFKSMSPFVIVCGLIAIIYVIYRLALLAYPVAVLEQRLVHPVHDGSIVCGQEGGEGALKDPVPILSSNYQQRIKQQEPLSENLIANSAITKGDVRTGTPVDYEHDNNSETVQYQFLHDPDEATNFLRVATMKDIVSSNAKAASWRHTPVALQSEQTYVYGFRYRSNTPVIVSIEYTTSTNEKRYTRITSLPASPSWQGFKAHFTNTVGASTFRVIAYSEQKGYIDTRAFDVHRITSGQLSRPLVSIAFDDGWQSVKSNALQVLNAHHIQTTQYIISDVANSNVESYMDIDTLTELKKAGHEIGSHSLRHCNQTTLDTATITDNAMRSKQLLESRSLGPIKTFAYPLGQYNKATQDVYTKYYPLIRSSDSGYNDRYFDETNIHSMAVLDTTSDDEFKSWLNYAKKYNMWVVIVYHRIDESGSYSVSHQQLDRQLTMLNESGITTKTISEAAQLIRR